VADNDVASRLSFFLWGSAPDAELLRAAGAGALGTQAGFTRQVKRMLADPRSRALADRFAAQWLRLQDLEKIIPDHLTFRSATDSGEAMGRKPPPVRQHRQEEERPGGDRRLRSSTSLAKHYGFECVG
jgi:hypothetical protein